MKIAVVGAGFLGLACAHALSGKHQVTIYDKEGIGKGASGIAAGLLHPYAGKKATLNWMGLEAYSQALELLQNFPHVLRNTGIFRPACTPDLYKNFLQASQTYPDCHWAQHFGYDGIFIQCGVQVDCQAYLQALFTRCQERGVAYEIATIKSAHDLDHFDMLVFTVGCGFTEIKDLNPPAIHAVKGQLLELEYSDTLPFAISAQSYVAQVHSGAIVAGSTYEHSFTTIEADLATCEHEIRAKVGQFSKTFAALKIKSCRAGLRATTPDKKPFIKRCGQWWCLGGLGSKGLLYHALLANSLLMQISVGFSCDIEEENNGWCKQDCKR